MTSLAEIDTKALKREIYIREAIIEEFEHNGHRVRILQDENPDSPREWDNLGEILYLKKSQYILGDRGVSHEEIREVMDSDDIWIPVHAYIHSGVSISTRGGYPYNDPWDGGMSGVIHVSKEKIKQEFGVNKITKKVRERAIKVLEGEIETYNQYFMGDVYGYIIDDGEDSCWGFYGIEYCREEAKAVAGYSKKD